jgi:intraflagellar transport protein 172
VLQVDSAIQHYIEAGAYASAVSAAIESKQIVRAAQLVDDTMRDPATARPFYLQIARHYHSTNALEEAEKYYVKAGEPAQAVDMYIAAGRWESSYAIARQVGVDQVAVWTVLFLVVLLAALCAVHV